MLASWRSMRSFGPYGNCARTTEREFRFKRRNVEFIVCSETVPVKENRGLGRLSGGGCRARSSLVVTPTRVPWQVNSMGIAFTLRKKPAFAGFLVLFSCVAWEGRL